MEDIGALIARRVRDVRTAWFNAPRMSRPIAGSARCQRVERILRPTSNDSELLDELADVAPPQPFAAPLPDVTGPMLRRAKPPSLARSAVRVGPLQARYTAALCN